jgi:hypothetical protein
MQEVETTRKKRIERPLGVYIVTVCDFLFVGLVPLLTLVLFLRGSDVELPFYQILMSVALYFIVMAASVWACVGDNPGRWLLLVAVTLTAVLWITNAILTLSYTELASTDKPRVLGFMSRGTIALAINWWYFNRKSTVAYYQQSSSR